MRDYISKVEKEMTGKLYPSRKFIYSEFEFDYVNELQKEYKVIRYDQKIYLFEHKETKVRYWVEINTSINDEQSQIDEFIVKDTTQAEILKHIIF